MPTGVPLHDAQRQLFDAAERLLVREGASALTSRAVTAEAGVAKGLLHRRFADFDAFLADLVLDRIARLEKQSHALLDAAGANTVADNLTDALIELFSPVAVVIVGLIVARENFRARLREAGTANVPLLGEGGSVIRAYLTAERDLGRLATGTDVRTLAGTLIGAVHLLCTEQETAPPARHEVHKIVTTVIGHA